MWLIATVMKGFFYKVTDNCQHLLGVQPLSGADQQFSQKLPLKMLLSGGSCCERLCLMQMAAELLAKANGTAGQK